MKMGVNKVTVYDKYGYTMSVLDMSGVDNDRVTIHVSLKCGHLIGDDVSNNLCCRLCEHKGRAETKSGEVEVTLGCGCNYTVEEGERVNDATCSSCVSHDDCHEDCIYAPDHSCSDDCGHDDACQGDGCDKTVGVKQLCSECRLKEVLQPASE